MELVPKKKLPSSAKKPPNQGTKSKVSKKTKQIPQGKKTPVPVIEKPSISSSYKCIDQYNDNLKFYLTELGPIKDQTFIFDYAPRELGWKSDLEITEYKTQGNTAQPLYFAYGSNKKLALTNIMFLEKEGVLPHEKLNQIQLMAKPRGTTIKVYNLQVGFYDDKRFVARSYGNFVITSLDIKELLRDSSSGKTLRASINLELTEVAEYQRNFGQDLAVPRAIVPTLPQGLKEEVKQQASSANQAVVQSKPNNSKIKSGTQLGIVASPEGNLNFTYQLPGLSVESTLKKKGWKPGGYPNYIMDAFSLGPHESAKSTPGSKAVKTASGLVTNLKLKTGKSVLSSAQLIGCPVTVNYNFEPVGYANGSRTISLKCTDKGKEGIYTWYYLNSQIKKDVLIGITDITRAPIPVAPPPPPSPPSIPPPPPIYSPNSPPPKSLTPASTGGQTRTAAIKTVQKEVGRPKPILQERTIENPTIFATWSQDVDVTVKNVSGKPLNIKNVNKGLAGSYNGASKVDLRVIDTRPGNNKNSDWEREAIAREWDKQIKSLKAVQAYEKAQNVSNRALVNQFYSAEEKGPQLARLDKEERLAAQAVNDAIRQRDSVISPKIREQIQKKYKWAKS